MRRGHLTLDQQPTELTEIVCIARGHDRAAVVVDVGFYTDLIARGDTPVRIYPVSRGLFTRRKGGTVSRGWCR